MFHAFLRIETKFLIIVFKLNYVRQSVKGDEFYLVLLLELILTSVNKSWRVEKTFYAFHTCKETRNKQ